MRLLYHIVRRGICIWGKINQMSKSKKIAPRKKVALELLHHRLGNIFNRSLMAGYISNVWKDIERRVDPDPFCTSCQIYSMKKRLGTKIH